MTDDPFVAEVLFRIVKRGNGDVEFIGCYLELYFGVLGKILMNLCGFYLGTNIIVKDVLL